MTDSSSDRLVMALTIPDFDHRSDADQRSIRQKLLAILDSTFLGAELFSAESELFRSGRGVTVFPRQGWDVARVRSYLDGFRRLLLNHNDANPPNRRFGIGVSVVSGEVRSGGNGIYGPGVDHALRIMASPRMTKFLFRKPEDMLVIMEGLLGGDGYWSEDSIPETSPKEANSFSARVLSPDPRIFVGRRREIEQLDAVRDSYKKGTRLAVVIGSPGIGKTALVKNWSDRSVDFFPDGRILLSARDLRENFSGAADPEATMRRLLRVLMRARGIPDEQIPADTRGRVEAYESLSPWRRSLIVLDGMDEVLDSAHLRVLAEPGPMVVLISRRQPSRKLHAFRHRVVEVGPLQLDEALHFLHASLDADRLSEEPIGVWEQIARIAGGLPSLLQLVVEYVAGHPEVSPRHVLQELTPDKKRDAHSPGRPSPTLIRFSYGGLSTAASGILRALSLTDSPRVSPELAAALSGGSSAHVTAALDELRARGLLYLSGDGGLMLSEQVREFAAYMLAEKESVAEIALLRERLDRYFLVQFGEVRRRETEPSIARDFWTLEDRLSHRRYADAIAAFVRHRETKPPLTIGVKAPWGAGKTSLMRMVQDNLDPGAGREAGEPRGLRLTSVSEQRITKWTRGRPEPFDRVTNRELLRIAEDPRAEEGASESLQAGSRQDGTSEPGWRPTVWFNPWMYQNGEQVWAGLAHEIISQVTSRLSVGDRERFWLRLNLARVDREAIRQRLYRLVVSRLLPLIALWVVAAVLTGVILLLGQILPLFQTVANWASASTITVGTVALIGFGVQRVRSFWKDTATGPLGSLVRSPDPLEGDKPLFERLGDSAAKVVRDPGYTARVGFLHLVQSDMRKVLDLVADEEQPLVVFIDDLDRCSSSAVAQVIEAINLFLAGQFPNCVFVVGMEPGAVAAHVEAANEGLVKAEREGRISGDWATLGWRFLGKIIQLPLSVPPPRNERVVSDYLRDLVGGAQPRSSTAPVNVRPAPQARPVADPEPSQAHYLEPEGEGEEVEPTMAPEQEGVRSVEEALAELEVDALERAIRRRGPTLANLRQVTADAQMEILSRPTPLTSSALWAADRVFGDLYSDGDAHEVLSRGLTWLGSSNPREVKRYVNLFRFHTFISNRRQLEELAAPDQEQVAKMAALAIRWPDVLSLLQYTGTEHPVAVLERSARAQDDELWKRTLKETLSKQETECTWAADLRTFLAAGPEIGEHAVHIA